MRIYAMTATFGKLEQASLTLKPGLNIIEAPNEWGKSTWCAFLAAMLYGLDTRGKSSKTALADKERYAPWSGLPMEGRMDIHWQGRDITIERCTKGRVPMGDFRAYETASGIPVKELTAANCGQQLLGVERSVFVRSAFIRFSDIPVTGDEALRRRLHALVTTGDESAAGDRLAKQLKELKNRCRYNCTGLIPQAEGERAALERTLGELDHLKTQTEKCSNRLAETDWQLAKLENHQKALAHRAAKEDAARVEAAEKQYEKARHRLESAYARCAHLPPEKEIADKLTELSALEEARQALHMEALTREEISEPSFAHGRAGEELLKQTIQDAQRYRAYTAKGSLVLPALLLAVAGLAAAYWFPAPGLMAACMGLCLLIFALIQRGQNRQRARQLAAFYGSPDPDRWLAEAQRYAAGQSAHWGTLRAREAELEAAIHAATDGLGLQQCRVRWEAARNGWRECSDARRAYETAGNHVLTLQAMARPVPPAAQPDELTWSAGETEALLSDIRQERLRLQSRLSQYAGRMEALGDRKTLEIRLAAVNSRITKLEQTYAALVLAQEILSEAAAELQRRFAPRIAKGAARRMGTLTAGRYDRVQLGQDLSLLAGAEGETTLREALWRSDGTVDQLYLSLRLAVAEALAPHAPLILDDALIRFDDTRLKAALKLLEEETETRQVILFTCQSRENTLIKTDSLN